MSTTEQDETTWFLARDGQQYGPITGLEMRKIIELGQLAETDLVWNETLTDWAPAQLAIDTLAPPRPEPRPITDIPPPPQPREATAPQAQQPEQAREQAAPAAERTEPRAKSFFDPPARETARPSPGGPAHMDHDPTTGPSRTSDQYRASPESVRATREPAGVGEPSVPPSAAAAPQSPYSPAAQQEPFGHAAQHANTITPEQHRRDVAVGDRYDDEDDGDNSGGIALKAIAAGLLIALIGGGGWLAYQNRASLVSIVDPNGANGSSTPVVRANDSNSSAALRTTSSITSSVTSTRSEFLDTVAWRSATAAFPTWASEREQQAVSMLQSGQSQADVRRHLIDELAKLRRRHAKDALSASPTVLRSVANAFLTNLRTLTGRSPQICFEFISKGETSPQILPLLDDAEASQTLLKQMHTVMDAIAEGRKTPQTYLPPRQSDYSLISSELSKMGWTGTDMRLFGDPQKLAAAAPEKVCQLVTDWFTAQLLISDQAIQARLLVQSLRPVVAG